MIVSPDRNDGGKFRPYTQNTIDLAQRIVETLRLQGPAGGWGLARRLKKTEGGIRTALIYLTETDPLLAEDDGGKLIYLELSAAINEHSPCIETMLGKLMTVIDTGDIKVNVEISDGDIIKITYTITESMPEYEDNH